jgi:hypothetical protein
MPCTASSRSQAGSAEREAAPARRRAISALRWHDLVEVRAAHLGRPFDELEPVGEEHADQRAGGHVEHPLDRRAVGPQPLGLPRRVAHLEHMGAVVVLRVHRGPRRRRAEADDLALVGRPARPAGAAEVQALEQVGLARAVATRDHGQPRAQRHLEALVAPEVAQRQAGDPHGALRRSAGSA